MTPAENQHSAPAFDFLSILIGADDTPAALMRAADAIGEAWNDMVPDGEGGVCDGLRALERHLEERILALPPGDPHRAVWALMRLSEALEDEGDHVLRLLRSALVDARALAGAV